MALAVSDLIVGVSNDATNFLNSAIGSKAAPRHVIMIVASIGIILGSVFSSGMMEVARSGVFFPEQFNFNDIMMLFLAVMFTDVILLDMFNTFGLPTSTTVSLVFELLGSAVAVAAVNIWDATGPDSLTEYINAGKALTIISGILLSVVLAFTVGAFVMFFSRMIFSFSYIKAYKNFGALWCGFAFTAITYFAVFKGLKDTTVLSENMKLFMNTNTMTLIGGSFVFWTFVMGLLQKLFKINILKITVLAGTFSLALAFAGNDLVNFIGVSMAGLSSYDIASAHVAGGGDLETLKMGALASKVQVNFLYLLAAGLIMIATLWLSKKARSVSETELNLSKQNEGMERFGSTPVSRTIVRSAMNFTKRYEKFAPKPVQKFIGKRFAPSAIPIENGATFDLVRATVNLTTASILIAMATSMKLPLSTTYVTFMVAMGTSLADKAWGRESAVYRITGVLTVISGWFLTAFIAFSVAFLVAMALMYTGQWGVYGFTILCAFIIIQSKILYAKKRKKIDAAEKTNVEEENGVSVSEIMSTQICNSMLKITDIYNQTLSGLFNEDRKLLKKMDNEALEMYENAHNRKHKILPVLKQLEEQHIETGHYFVQVVDYLNETSKALMHITGPSFKHIDNNHEGLGKEQIEDLRKIGKHVDSVYKRINEMLTSCDFTQIDSTLQKRDELFEVLAEAIKRQVKRVMDNNSSTRSSMLYLEIINETKNMVLQSRNLLKSQKGFITKQK